MNLKRVKTDFQEDVKIKETIKEISEEFGVFQIISYVPEKKTIKVFFFSKKPEEKAKKNSTIPLSMDISKKGEEKREFPNPNEVTELPFHFASNQEYLILDINPEKKFVKIEISNIKELLEKKLCEDIKVKNQVMSIHTQLHSLVRNWLQFSTLG